MDNPSILSHAYNTAPAFSSTQDSGFTHQHALNRDKQTRKLIENASRADIDIEINCNGENVYITGFYAHVVRPCLLSITPGHQISYGGLTFELKNVSPQELCSPPSSSSYS